MSQSLSCPNRPIIQQRTLETLASALHKNERCDESADELLAEFVDCINQIGLASSPTVTRKEKVTARESAILVRGIIATLDSRYQELGLPPGMTFVVLPQAADLLDALDLASGE